MKPTSISAEALFEAHREALHWEWVAGHAHPERRFDEAAVRDAHSAADLVGYLNYIHPYRVQIVGRREVAYLSSVSPEDQERRISRIVTLEPPVLIVGRRRGAAGPPGGDVRPRRDPAVRHRRVGRPRDRRGARLPGAALRRAHDAPRRVHGHPRPGRAAHRRVGPGQERARARADLARPRPGGRRRGRSVPRVADVARRPLPGAAGQPARGARHRPAGHQGHLRRDGGAPEDAPEADRAPGAQGDDGARVRAPALRAAVRGDPGRAGAQGRHRGRCRPQPGGAGGGRGAQHHPAAARHRHLPASSSRRHQRRWTRAR